MKRMLTIFLLAVIIVPLLSTDSYCLAFEQKKSRHVAAVTGDELAVSVRKGALAPGG